MKALRIILGLNILATLILLNNHINLGFLINSLSHIQDLLPLFERRASVLAISLLIETCLLITTWTPWKNCLVNLLEHGLAILKRLGPANLILFALEIGLIFLFPRSSQATYYPEAILRISIAWFLCVGGAILLKAVDVGTGWVQSMLVTALLLGAGYKLSIFTFDISAYPFSLSWSEASRFYYASLFFSEKLYDISISPSILHPSRYLMQAVPFLISNSPLWLHRTWQVFLWLATTTTTVWLLARRITIKDRISKVIFGIWAALFLLMGPVYYHLQVITILILWGYQRNKPWRTLLVVTIASVWAGLSRINWLPVPGMLAATMYFLEVPKERASAVNYLSKPTLWVFSGTAVGYFSQELYARLSGNPAELFGSSFSSQLLWYRLWPNATYQLGILPGALAVLMPALLAVSLHLNGRWKHFHILRLLGVSAIQFVLFCGGLIVSVKIGGGSNLHNMDAFFSVFLVFSVYTYFDQFSTEDSSAPPQVLSPTLGYIHQASLVAALVIPLIIAFEASATQDYPDQQQIAEAISTIQAEVSAAKSNGGSALFVSERQLITFDTITGVEMFPEYEKVFLMEMAMAGNANYFKNFYQDLALQRFTLIVSEPLNRKRQDQTDVFGNENNAWVDWVSKPLLCYYQPLETLKEVGIQLLVPRASTQNCNYTKTP